MSKIKIGLILTFGTPIVYLTARVFNIIPPVSYIEAFGGCGPLDSSGKLESLGTTSQFSQPQMCWDGIRTVLDPIGLSLAIFSLILLITGLILVGAYIIKNKQNVLRNSLVLLAKFAFVLAFLSTLLVMFFFWLSHFGSKSSNCNELSNSYLNCSSNEYLPYAIGFSILSVLLLIVMIRIARKEIKGSKSG